LSKTKNKLLFLILSIFILSKTYALELEIGSGIGYESLQKNSSFYEINSFIITPYLKIPLRLKRIVLSGTIGYTYSSQIRYPKLGVELDYLLHPDYMPFIGIKTEIKKYDMIIDDTRVESVFTLSFVGGSKIIKLDNSSLWLKIDYTITSFKKNIVLNSFSLDIGYSFNI